MYVYKTNIFDGREQRTKMILVADSLKHESASGGRFGAVIEALGDLDGDGLGDFAVAAPFEGQGAVYIYRGSRSFTFQGEKEFRTLKV